MVFFTHYLRPMRAFSSIEDLKQTVQTNIAQARAIDTSSTQALVELLG
jgi:FAD synthase